MGFIPANEIRILVTAVAPAADLTRFLTEAEREEEKGFASESARALFLTARISIRRVLGDLLRVDPLEISLARRPEGKPYLPAHPDLCFNVSHSGALVLIGLSQGREIGVDIEKVRERPRWRELAVRFFSFKEQAATRDLESFLRIWTRKEAYLKLRGGGIDRALNSFSVLGEDSELNAVLVPLTVPDGYVASLAVDGNRAIELNEGRK